MVQSRGIALTTDAMAVLLGQPPTAGKRQWLYDRIKAIARNGALPAGTPLPSSRNLAAHLELSRGTVVQALDQLVAEGLLTSRNRSGLEVSQLVRPGRPIPAVVHRPRVVASPGTPDLGRFPRKAWLTSTKRILDELPAHELGYPDPQGVPRLRTVLADHLRLTRGVEASADNIMVTSGVSHALTLAAIALHAMTVTTIAVEDPGPQGPIDVLAAAGLDIAPLAVDDAGFRCDLVTPDVRAVFVTPAHQFPLETTMTPGRRRDVAEWAAGCDGVIVEDDYDAELRYSGHPIASLQSLIPARTFHMGSVSKTLSPGLRLGWIVAPVEAIAACLDHRRSTDLGQSVLEQHTLADMIASGAYARHLRSSRRAYKSQRQHMLERLRKLGHGSRFDPRVDAGLHVTVVVDSPLAETEMIDSIRAAGLVCEPLSAMYRAEPARFGAVVRTVE